MELQFLYLKQIKLVNFLGIGKYAIGISVVQGALLRSKVFNFQLYNVQSMLLKVYTVHTTMLQVYSIHLSRCIM